MWNFTNELEVQEPELLKLLNDYIAFIKQYTMQKWNRFIPITVAVIDRPNTYDFLMQNLNVDIFSSNAGYRGFSFTGTRNTPYRFFFDFFKIYGLVILHKVFLDLLNYQRLTINHFSLLKLDGIQ